MSIQSIDAPIAVRTIDVGVEPVDVSLGRDPDGREYNALYAIATRGGLAIGAFFVRAVGGTITSGALRAAIAEHAVTASEDRQPASDFAPLVSVVICAIDGGYAAVRTVETILSGDYPAIEVIVVNNRPGNGALDPVAAAFADDPRVRTAEEPRPGLSYARNAGIAEARGEIVAFTDDDAVPDARWIERIVAAFAENPGASCVTGLIVPLALDTDAQVLLERFAGFSKGFSRRRWSLAECSDEPMFPYRAGQFGSGANIALRRGALDLLGGYDDALGIGTPAHGGEDLDLFIRVLMHGMELVYEPAAMVWHEHPRTIEHIEREVSLYGSGLTAALFKQLIHGPRRRRLIGGLGSGARYALSPSSEKNERKGADFPLAYTLAELRGMLYGPIGYLRSRRFVRRNKTSRGAKRGALMGLLIALGMLGGGESTESARAETGESTRTVRMSARDKSGGGPPPELKPLDSSSNPVRFEPTWVDEVELTAPAADLVAGPRDDGGDYTRASLLVRLDGEPLGFVAVPLIDGRIGGAELRAAIDELLGTRARERRLEIASRRTAPAGTPFASVVICSRDRAESLARTLGSALALDYPGFEIVVVDNAP
ncbi:MAG: glycosyltransferase family 2 protein, partial [Actinobacteria bacterium]|nr:glycosyltransferase family 2 protein [Actinomycetota bacterium]